MQRTSAMTAALFCALAGGLLQINTFLRMYTMLMFYTTLLTWLHVKYLHEDQPLRFFIYYPLAILSGMLTHRLLFYLPFFAGNVFWHFASRSKTLEIRIALSCGDSDCYGCRSFHLPGYDHTYLHRLPGERITGRTWRLPSVILTASETSYKL